MHELGRPGRRPTRQVIHFTEKNGIPAAGCVARDAAAIDAAANDGEIENPVQQTFSPALASSLWRFCFRFCLKQNQIRKQPKSELCVAKMGPKDEGGANEAQR